MEFRYSNYFFALMIFGSISSCSETEAPHQMEPIALPILEQPVTILRDDRGIPYIYAGNLLDAFRAQGFVTAQDRLYQMTMLHRTFNGRLAETIGEYGLMQDRITHIVNIPGIARKQAAILDDGTRAILQAYADGVNAYIGTMQDDYPPVLASMHITPDLWRVEDQLAMLLLLNWGSAANQREELLTLQIIGKVGLEKAAEIHQLSINPDDNTGTKTLAAYGDPLGLEVSEMWATRHFKQQRLGSNNWAISGSRTSTGKPILANDPHLPVTTPPGTWYPLGIITPDLRIVGASSGWSPGIFVGRTSHIAMGVTNALGDMVDLTIEQIDPDNPHNYLEGDKSIPFDVRTETILVRDPAAEKEFREETLTIRSTRRGPIISDHGMATANGRAISLRWSAGEFLTPAIGIDKLFLAKNVDEARHAAQNIDASITMAFVDMDGNIGHQSSGVVPIRTSGAAPQFPLGVNEWRGRIPRPEMPGVTNPSRGWVGSANQRMISPDYPHYYSASSAASWRYRRLVELMDGENEATAEAQWQNQRDASNMMARRFLPLMLPALPDDSPVAHMLRGWDGVDRMDSVAPTIFQALVRHAAMETFKDELGPDLALRMLSSTNYWQDRFEALLTQDSTWFDDTTSPEVEDRDAIVRRAAKMAWAELNETLGTDQNAWQWGKVHQITFKSPVPGMALPTVGISPGPHPMAGSDQTLYRAGTLFHRPNDVLYGASLRMVVDMADPDKIMAVQPGGVSGRVASPHLSDQVEDWLSGDVTYWWFSDEAIKEHAVSTQILQATR